MFTHKFIDYFYVKCYHTFLILGNISPFCEATDTPVLDFCWHRIYIYPGFQRKLTSLACVFSHLCAMDSSHTLQCDNCQPLDVQHGNQAFLSIYLYMHTQAPVEIELRIKCVGQCVQRFKQSWPILFSLPTKILQSHLLG